MYVLSKSLKMTKQEIIDYDNLPDNSPDTKLNTKQISFVNSLYCKYLERKITKGWGVELYEIERRKNWPSGPRVKTHEAKRFILSNLVELNKRGNLTTSEAADKFLSAMNCRESYTILLSQAYSKNK